MSDPIGDSADLRDVIRARKPSLAAKAAGGRSPKSATRLHCLECMGNNEAEVRRCTSTKCFLWPYRLPHPVKEPK